MTIKQHIVVSVAISIVLIVIIACHEKNNESNTNIQREEKTTDIIEESKSSKHKNLFSNSDFSEGLKNWRCDKNILVIQLNNSKNGIEISGSTNSQTRLFQTVSTVSGHVYKLSFKAKSTQTGAFAIFRDDLNNSEKYLYVLKTDDWKEYSKNFMSLNTGNHRIFLSCKGDGKYYFSDISLVDLNE